MRALRISLLLFTIAANTWGSLRSTSQPRLHQDECNLAAGCITEGQTLYWRPSRSGLAFAMGQDPSGMQASVLDIEPNFGMGFESAVGYRSTSGLEFLSRYIHLNLQEERRCTNEGQTLWNLRIADSNFIDDTILETDGKYSLRYDVADVDLAAHIDIRHALVFRPFIGFRYLDLEQSLFTRYIALGTAEVEETQKVDGYGTHCGANVLINCGKGSSIVAGAGFNLLYSTSSIKYVNSGAVINSLCVRQKLDHPIFGWETFIGLGFNWRCLDVEFGYQINHFINACANLQQVGFRFDQARETSLQMSDLGLDGAYCKASYVF